MSKYRISCRTYFILGGNFSMENEGKNLSLPIVGALLAAIIGGAIWAGIAIVSDYEIGIVAWAIGGLSGYLVYYLSKGEVAVSHQVIAVVGSLIGILLGKYFILGYYINDSISGIFQGESISLFVDNISVLFGGMDIIFVLLAVATAWQLPAQLSQKSRSKNPTSEPAQESAAE